MKVLSVILSIFIVFITGCSSDNYQSGEYVSQMKSEQLYNPDATKENLGYVPDGLGERMEKSYGDYTGKSTDDLGDTSSQVLDQ